MTVQQKTSEILPSNRIDAVEAMRRFNEWETAGALSRAFRIKIFRDYSAEFIEPFLKYHFGTIGLRCELELGGFNTFHQDLIEQQDLASYDLLVLSLSGETLVHRNQDEAEFDTVCSGISGLIERVCSRSSATLLVNTLIKPLDESPFRAAAADSLTSRVNEYNRRLRHAAAGYGSRCLVIDWERLVMLVGVDASFDRRMAYVASAPFRHDFLNLYAQEILRVGRVLQGQAKKCLVLDCDNTLWGGIVGEVGINGIALDANEYPGKAYYDFQKAVLRLAEQGIMVALCSKNNLADVMAVLEQHPHCLIKNDHLVASRINWDDKELNIQQLVADLNIGMDAVVYVDDSPIECARVRSFLPELTVRQVPDRLYDLPTLFDREGLFDRVATTDEDRSRTAMYQHENKRRESERAFATAEEFLASLNLTARIHRAKENELTRISQLTQKTNQFNLTTRRYSEGDIARMTGNPDYAVYSLAASDRFGELGLTGVLIASRRDSTASIDTLLLSCRALGRRLEECFVTRCLEDLTEKWKPATWWAQFVKTAKNDQAKDFWPRFGFKEIQSESDGKKYQADAAGLILPRIHFINVETG